MKNAPRGSRIVSFGCRFDLYDKRDFRYAPGPRALPVRIDRRGEVARIMNQNPEGSCTGHAVCAAAEFLYWGPTGRKVDLSQRWAYRKAREIDPWPGENYHGSTTRAAVRAWADFGICEEEFWEYKPYQTSDESPEFDLVEWEGEPKSGAAENARKYSVQTYNRCLTAYEIKHAIHENGIVIVGATVHSGWDIWGEDTIGYLNGVAEWGGHAFVLVGYDEEEQVYYIANSWGPDWGIDGLGKLSYEDARANIRDAWTVTVPDIG